MLVQRQPDRQRCARTQPMIENSTGRWRPFMRDIHGYACQCGLPWRGVDLDAGLIHVGACRQGQQYRSPRNQNEASETFPLSRSSSMHSSNDLRREAGVGSMPGDGLDLLAAAACIG